ncbi:hypothetical protein FACS189472_14370 [Alphaproteobacteria bacterium]|nr:hypothetical protein FACS189472_14370 [Alphaproteobacteria bacterium]
MGDDKCWPVLNRMGLHWRLLRFRQTSNAWFGYKYGGKGLRLWFADQLQEGRDGDTHLLYCIGRAVHRSAKVIIHGAVVDSSLEVPVTASEAYVFVNWTHGNHFNGLASTINPQYLSVHDLT